MIQNIFETSSTDNTTRESFVKLIYLNALTLYAMTILLLGQGNNSISFFNDFQ